MVGRVGIEPTTR